MQVARKVRDITSHNPYSFPRRRDLHLPGVTVLSLNSSIVRSLLYSSVFIFLSCIITFGKIRTTKAPRSMPFHQGLLPREGFTGEVLGPLIKKTLFNPSLTIPLILLARFTKKGGDLAILHETAFKRVKILAALGLIRWVNGYLNHKSLNNGVKDTYTWSQEIVLITGGAGGIGGEVVKLLSEKGVKVVVLDVIPMSFQTSSNVHYFKCDITNAEAIKNVAAQVRKTIGNPTVLVLNAGVARGKSILDSTEKDVRFTFDVNTISHYLLAKEFLPHLIAKNHGMVVTVASMASFVTVPKMVDYGASKSAALSFHEGLSAELLTLYKAPRVRTVCINQGYTKTALFQGYQNDSKFLMPTLEVQTVAEAIAKAIFAGNGDQIILPGFGKIIAFLRGFPHWMQRKTRADGVNIMTKWHGRQVIDVEKEYGVKKDDVSGSTVLVDKQ